MEVRLAAQNLLRSTTTSTPALLSRAAVIPSVWRTLSSSSRSFSTSPPFLRSNEAASALPPRPPPPAAAAASPSSPPRRAWPSSSGARIGGNGNNSKTATSPLWTKPRSPSPSNDGSQLLSRLGLPAKGFKLPTSSFTDAMDDATSHFSPIKRSGRTASGGSPAAVNFDALTNKDSGAEKPALRLVPSLGRTIHVTSSIDVAKAFRTCETICRRNSVAKDFRRQRFHERAGMKRKRLRSQRWRMRFKSGFVATVKRVQELARQGW